MNKKFLIGVALASFSLSSIAQVNTKVIGNVTIQTPNGQGGTYSPQPGITIQSASNLEYNNKNNASNNIGTMAGIDMGMGSNADNGIGNGAPDLSELQAQSIATAQALKESSEVSNSPINIQAAPEGAAEILKNGPNVLQTNDTKQLGALTNTTQNNSMVHTSHNQVNLVVKSNKPKSDVIVTNISAWNQTTINKFEQDGKARTEARYKEFLLNK
jgi:hypothetical protein